MPKKTKEAVNVALHAIEKCKHRILMFEYALQDIRGNHDRFNDAVEVIYSRLYRKLNEAYAALFMWGNVVPEEAQKEAKKAAFKHYLKERSAIMEYLDIELESPGSWFADEEEEFRKEIEEAKTK